MPHAAFTRFTGLKGSEMTDKTESVVENDILNALSEDTLGRMRPLLERTEMLRGKILYRADEEISHVYFPDRSMISLVAYTENGQGAEVSVIGCEGATGLDVVLGSDRSSNENIVQLPNGAYRMKAEDFKKEFARNGDLHDEILKFIRKLIVQISHTALCNRLHNTEMRLSRWLLMCHDRSPSDVLQLTQEFISIMLGSNRTTVTMTAIALQNAGFISYTRGTITMIDRAGLEAFTCPCYASITAAYKSFPAPAK
jgi:CRP-like cAMP-binding protein